MKDKILGIISLITVFVPFTIFFFWKPTAPNATAIIIGYCIFIALSFCYALVLFFARHQRDYLYKGRTWREWPLSLGYIGIGSNSTFYLK